MSTSIPDVERLKKELAELKKGDQKRYNEFRRKYFRYWKPDDEAPDDDTDIPPPAVDDGRPQPEKKANKDPNKWKVVNMKDDPTLFKIVDDKGVNVADLFHSQENAQAYITRAIHEWTYPPTPEPGPKPTPTPTPEPGPGGVFDENTGPYPALGPKLAASQRGPTERHYASGKPSDWTIEKNVKEIDYDNYQWVTFQTIHAMAHDDTCSHKLGGTHMGSGWFDHSVGIYTGKTGLGYEPDHPETHLFVIKGPSIGDIREKKIGIATTYFKKTNHTELWTNVGDGWKKQVEGTDVGDFNPKSEINEAQLRIDGFKAKNTPPTIHSAFVEQIAGP